MSRPLPMTELLTYTQHKSDCNRMTVKYGPNNLRYNGLCDCGLDKLKREVRDAEAATQANV